MSPHVTHEHVEYIYDALHAALFEVLHQFYSVVDIQLCLSASLHFGQWQRVAELKISSALFAIPP